MDIILYGAVVSAIVQAVKMVQAKWKPDLVPNEVYIVLALVLGVAFALGTKNALETGFVVGFTAMGMYSGIKGGVAVVKQG